MHKIANTAAHSLPVYPTQLMHSSVAVLLAVIVWLYGRSRLKRNRGDEILLLGMLYPWARFAVEFLRGDNKPEYLFGSLTISQSVGIFVFIGCLAVFAFRRWKGLGKMEQQASKSENTAENAK